MKYVPYYRVSTATQGKSGLGLAAQQDIVQRFLKTDDSLLDEFIEVESGNGPTGLNWPQPSLLPNYTKRAY